MFDAYKISMGEPKNTKTGERNGQWCNDGTITIRISPGDMDISASLELPYRGATSPAEARRQALESLRVIGDAFANFATEQLGRRTR